ncbi:hypothetical protein Tco_0074749, partial [Tanacetum coccineum]
MTVCDQPVMSHGHSARVTEVMALSDSAFHKRYRSSYETPSPSPSPTLSVRKRYIGMSELILGIDSVEDEIGGEDIDEDEGDESLDTDDEREGLDDDDRGLDDDDCGLDDEDRGLDDDDDRGLDDEDHGLDDKGRRVESDELGLEEEEEVAPYGQGSGSIPEPERQEKVSALRQPTLTTWTDPEDGRTYIDNPTYPPPTPPVQTPPSPEWSSGSLHVSPTPSAFPSPVSSPMISLTIPSPIASPVATPTATILVD